MRALPIEATLPLLTSSSWELEEFIHSRACAGCVIGAGHFGG